MEFTVHVQRKQGPTLTVDEVSHWLAAQSGVRAVDESGVTAWRGATGQRIEFADGRVWSRSPDAATSLLLAQMAEALGATVGGDGVEIRVRQAEARVEPDDPRRDLLHRWLPRLVVAVAIVTLLQYLLD